MKKNVLDLHEYSNGEMDCWIEKYQEIWDTFKQKVMSVLIIDPNDKMPIDHLELKDPDIFLKYFDLGKSEEGDYRIIGKHFHPYLTNGECGYDGLIFDNIDHINAGADTEDLQMLVWQALKRDEAGPGDGYSILPGDILPFDKMMIMARCKEIPDYLRGKSLLTRFIEI